MALHRIEMACPEYYGKGPQENGHYHFAFHIKAQEYDVRAAQYIERCGDGNELQCHIRRYHDQA